MKNPIVVLAGPTASGKTAMAIELAKKYNGEIINADSRSIYVGMDLGTGKPTEEEKEGIPHHLFDIVTPDQNFNFVQYKKLANQKIKEIHEKGKIPFIVGGTGLYIDAVVYDFEPAGEADWNFRNKMEELNSEELFKLLQEKDPETAMTIEPNNKRRVIRALEIINQTGQGKTLQEKKKEKPTNIIYLAIETDRENLYEKINKRVDVWMQQDFEKEVRSLLEKYSLESPGMNGIGYKQIGLYLKGMITKDEAIENFKKGDRNLAKRQITWLKRNKDICWIDSIEKADKAVLSFLSKKTV